MLEDYRRAALPLLVSDADVDQVIAVDVHVGSILYLDALQTDLGQAIVVNVNAIELRMVGVVVAQVHRLPSGIMDITVVYGDIMLYPAFWNVRQAAVGPDTGTIYWANFNMIYFNILGLIPNEQAAIRLVLQHEAILHVGITRPGEVQVLGIVEDNSNPVTIIYSHLTTMIGNYNRLHCCPMKIAKF